MSIAAVTGASGHLGGALVRALLKEGRKVRVLVRQDRRALAGLDIEYVEGDVLDFNSLLALADGTDMFFNLAARISISSHDRDIVEKINVQGVANVVRACMDKNVGKLVHVSSIDAFSTHPNDQLVTEERALVEGSRHLAYDRSKAEGQRIVQRSAGEGLDAVVINPSAIIGPFDFKISRLGEVMLDIYHRRYPMLIDGGHNWVDVRDVADGVLAAERRGRKGECYLLSGHWVHLAELAALIAELTGRKTPTGAIPLWLASVVGAFNLGYAKLRGKTPKFTPQAIKTIRMHRYISHSKAATELGFNPRPFKETVRDTLEWFGQAGMLDGE